MVLFVCGGNTCRSPMAKVILEQKVKAKENHEALKVDSAAYDHPTYHEASAHARGVIKKLFGDDLLAPHKSKKLSPDLVEQADLILVMAARMRRGLPQEKSWTLKEYAGGSGDIVDPFGSNLDTYLGCAEEISVALESILPKLCPHGKRSKPKITACNMVRGPTLCTG